MLLWGAKAPLWKKRSVGNIPSWQDLIFGIGSLLFIIALLPTLLGNNKPAWETAAITSVVLYAFSICYASLDLPFATITSAITASIWLAIAIQSSGQQQKDWYE